MDPKVQEISSSFIDGENLIKEGRTFIKDGLNL